MFAAPRLCISPPHRLLADWLGEPELATIVAGRRRVIELRCDRLQDWPPDGLAQVLARVPPRRLMVTCRPGRAGAGASRVAGWSLARQAAEAEVTLVDVPLSAALAAPRAWAALRRACRRTQIIVSLHARRPLPLSLLRKLWQAASALGAEQLKVVVPVRDAWGALPLVQLGGQVAASRAGARVIPLASGAAGQFTRVLLGRFAPGAAVTYAGCADETLPTTGAGQLPWTAMEQLWRFHAIGPQTPVWAVLGDPVTGSWSPRVHNALLAASGRAGVYVALAASSRPAALVRALAGPLGLCGLSVTTPHKRAMATECRRMGPGARRMAAVNTVLLGRAGHLVGHNTDGPAARACLEAGLGRLAGRCIAVLGTGGLARAVAVSLADAGAEVLVVSRDGARGAGLAREVAGRAVQADALAGFGDQLAAVVNATPVGMAGGPSGSPLAGMRLSPATWVQETIYLPRLTPLIAQARAAGCRTGSGVEMFARQAALQARLFFGVSPSADQLMARLQVPWLGEAPPPLVVQPPPLAPA